MEINRFEDVIGVQLQAATVEGRFVVLVANTLGGTIMNTNEDLPGARIPATAEEAKRAKFCVTWAVDNRSTPIVDYPSTTYDFRGGWVNSTAGELTGQTMWLTHPGNQESGTIPSGYEALGYTEGTFTIPSGQYIYDANIIVPGAAIIVANTATDTAAEAGKPKYAAAMAVGVIGFTETYDT
ncbi:hypothetical protein MUO98_00400, partial [Candidatus Bathyarchaeota archaeon]|nr:hypothetical protein [Candidatus Bathyarchaeota archaeon]